MCMIHHKQDAMCINPFQPWYNLLTTRQMSPPYSHPWQPDAPMVDHAIQYKHKLSYRWKCVHCVYCHPSGYLPPPSSWIIHSNHSHWEGIQTCDYQDAIIFCLINAYQHYVADYFNASGFWHNMWVDNGRPYLGVIGDLRHKTRAKYHHVCKMGLKLWMQILGSDEMAEAILKNDNQGLAKMSLMKKSVTYLLTCFLICIILCLTTMLIWMCWRKILVIDHDMINAQYRQSTYCTHNSIGRNETC